MTDSCGRSKVGWAVLSCLSSPLTHTFGPVAAPHGKQGDGIPGLQELKGSTIINQQAMGRRAAGVQQMSGTRVHTGPKFESFE